MQRETQSDFSDEKANYQQADIRSKRESKKNRKSDSEGFLHGPPGWNTNPGYTLPPQQSPQYSPWVPETTYMGMPMPTGGGPVRLTNINSGNVTTKITSNVGNNNSIKIGMFPIFCCYLVTHYTPSVSQKDIQMMWTNTAPATILFLIFSELLHRTALVLSSQLHLYHYILDYSATSTYIVIESE